MTIEAGRISLRLAYLAQEIYDHLDLITEWIPDFYDIIVRQRLSSEHLRLRDGTSITLFEKYQILEHQLLIARYAYCWYDAAGKLLLRADNSPHHDVITKPHHVHDFRGKEEVIHPFFGQDKDMPNITMFFVLLKS